VVRLVLDSGLPALDFTQPSSSTTEQQSLEHNRQVVRDTTAADWLPRVTTDSEGRQTSAQLVDCGDVSVPETYAGLDTMTVVGLDPADPGVVDTTAVASGSDTAYMSPTHLYVAASPWADSWRGFGIATAPMDVSQPTRIYGFDLSGTSATY